MNDSRINQISGQIDRKINSASAGEMKTPASTRSDRFRKRAAAGGASSRARVRHRVLIMVRRHRPQPANRHLLLLHRPPLSSRIACSWAASASSAAAGSWVPLIAAFTWVE